MLIPEFLKWEYRIIHYKYLYPNDSVFIHIPKTGGLSYYKSKYKISLGHFSIKEFQEKTKLFDKKFTTIFRNPVDRFVSSINHMRNNGGNDSQFNDKKFKEKFGKSNIEEILKFLENNLDSLNYLDPIFREQSFYLINSNSFQSLKIYNFSKFNFKKKINLNSNKKDIILTDIQKRRINYIYSRDSKIFSQIEKKEFVKFFKNL